MHLSKLLLIIITLDYRDNNFIRILMSSVSMLF